MRGEVWRRAYGRDFENGESHNTTFSYNAVAAVAALATLDLLTDDLIARVRDLGETFRRDLAGALAGSPLVEEVRGRGLMLGVKLRSPDHPWLSFEHFGFPELQAEGRSTIAPLLCHRLYRRGFFCFSCGHDWSVFRMQPRFFIGPEKLRAFAAACRDELDYLARLI
jgi:4-aminobutyrate aminotransferase-like enzyme